MNLDDLVPTDSSFPHLSTERLLAFGRRYKKNAPESRWSLVECGLQSQDWAKFLHWARHCSPSHIPAPRSLQTGILLLVVGTAVARTQENDVLWAPVAANCSFHLKQAWFGCREYPSSECRISLRDACQILGLRNQLHLRGKMHYWRTIMLQFGFNPQVAQRQLPIWLNGYVVPETIRTLLDPGDENCSESFHRFWAALDKIAQGSTSAEVEAVISGSPWCPEDIQNRLLAGLRQARTRPVRSSSRIEDEDRNPTLFDLPRIGDGSFALSLSRTPPKEISDSITHRLPFSMQGVGPHFIVRDVEGHLALDGGPLYLPIRDVLRQPVREVKIMLPNLSSYRERFAFWNDAEDIVLFAGKQGRRVLDNREVKLNLHRPYSLIVRADFQVRNGSDILSYEIRSETWQTDCVRTVAESSPCSGGIGGHLGVFMVSLWRTPLHRNTSGSFRRSQFSLRPGVRLRGSMAW